MNKKNIKGLTLIEILIGVAITALMMGAIVPPGYINTSLILFFFNMLTNFSATFIKSDFD